MVTVEGKRPMACQGLCQTSHRKVIGSVNVHSYVLILELHQGTYTDGVFTMLIALKYDAVLRFSW